MKSIKKETHNQQWYSSELRLALETTPVLHPVISKNPLKWKYKAKELSTMLGRTKNAVENMRIRYKGEVLSKVSV